MNHAESELSFAISTHWLSFM